MQRSRSWPLLIDSSEPDSMPESDQNTHFLTNPLKLFQSFVGGGMFISQRHGIFYSFDGDSIEEQDFPASIQRQASRSSRRMRLGIIVSSCFFNFGHLGCQNSLLTQECEASHLEMVVVVVGEWW